MRREGLGIGIFFLAAGVLFLMDALGALDLRAEFLLPLLLIGFGIALIASGRDRAPAEELPPAEDREVPVREEQVPPEPPPPTPPPPPDEVEDRDR